MNIDLSTGTPPSSERTLQLAETLAEITRVLNHATMHHAALRYPSDADRLIREISSAASRLPQILGQIARWMAAEDAASRVEVPSGEWAGLPGTAVTALAVRLDAASATAEALRADLEHAAQVTSGLALREDGTDG